MATLIFIGAAVALFGAAAIAPLVGLRRLLVVALLLTLCVIPYPLMTATLSEVHYGITDGAYLPMTYTLVVGALAIAYLRDRGVRVWLAFAGTFGLYLLVLIVFYWGGSDAQWSGAAHLVTAMVAVAVGVGIGAQLLRDEKLARLVVIAALGIVGVELLFCAAQLLGVPVSVYSTVDYFVNENRPIGTFNHPSVLGKVALTLAIVLLPLTRVTSKTTSRMALIALLAFVPLVAATQARSNVVALLGALFIWLILDYRRSIKSRLILVGAASVAAIPVALALVPRFLSDPSGGDRPELLETGLAQIAKEPLFGIGVNSYSAVVGASDELAATGFPVHNAYLLGVAELGVAGAVLVFVPFLVALIVAAVKFRRSGASKDAALAIVATTPGILLICLTGWGMLTEGSLVLWYAATGIALGMMLNPRLIERGSINVHSSDLASR